MPRASDGGPLGPLEREVMEVLWGSKDSLAVRDVLERLNRRRKPKLAYTTVMTVLSRLAEKEVVTREKVGRGYAYLPAVSDQAGIAVRGVLRDFGDAAVAHFVEEARADPELLDRLRRLMRKE